MFISLIKYAIKLMEENREGADLREKETYIKIFYRLIYRFCFR